jgi:hypothetical protein
MLKLLLIIVTMMSLFLFGCVTTDQDVENEPGNAPGIGEPGIGQEQQESEPGAEGEPGLSQEQQEFQQGIEDQLSGLDTRMDQLAEQANQLPEDAQAEFNQRIEQLEQR